MNGNFVEIWHSLTRHRCHCLMRRVWASISHDKHSMILLYFATFFVSATLD
jgi:hypothetical protein